MSPVFKLTILTQTYNFWNTNNFLLASLSLQAKLGINYSFCLVPNFPLLIISLPFHAPSPCPSALSLACTNPFVVDREALALAKLLILEGLVQLRGAYMPFRPFLQRAYLWLQLPTSSILSFFSPPNNFFSLFACLCSFSPPSSCLHKSWASPGELEDTGPFVKEHAFEEQCSHSAAAAVLTEGKCTGGGISAAGSHGLGTAFGNWSEATAPKKLHRCPDHQDPPGSALCTANWYISGHL